MDIVILYTTEALTFKGVLDNLHKPEFKCMEWFRIERFSVDDKNLGWIWFYKLYGKWEIEAKTSWTMDIDFMENYAVKQHYRFLNKKKIDFMGDFCSKKKKKHHYGWKIWNSKKIVFRLPHKKENEKKTFPNLSL